MARRGDELREHMLWAAKSVFLEVGFERASMDAIAERAATSKRTLYAHFDSKENLFRAVFDLVRALSLAKLKRPGAYSNDPEDALVAFCARVVECSTFAWTIRMCRLSVAEAQRFPDASARYFDVVFATPHAWLSAYLGERFELSPAQSADAAQALLSQVVHPPFTRALFGLDALSEELDDEAIRGDLDLEPVRRAVARWLASLA